MAESGKPKRILRCTLCKRILTECNREPCSGKFEKKASRAIPSPADTNTTIGETEDAFCDQDGDNFVQRKSSETIRTDAVSQYMGQLIYNEQTCELQGFLIGQLESMLQLRGSTQWCLIRRYHELGAIVDVLVEALGQRWVLNDILFPWSDLIHQKAVDDIDDLLEFCRQRLPVGSEFRAVVLQLCKHTVKLSMSRNANPKIRLPLDVQLGRGSSRPSKFRYLIVLDLEASCDYAPQPVVDVRTAEITEFPWVVLDTQSGDILFERQLFVRPENIDGVTYYCTKLTGISQDMVKNGVPLAVAIQELDNYISSTFGEDRGALLMTPNVMTNRRVLNVSLLNS